MSLEITNGVRPHCTQMKEFDVELTWRPERNVLAGEEMEIRVHSLRAFNSWRWARMQIDPGDLVFRWKTRPSTSEKWQNRERVILRARFQYGLRAGQPVVIRLGCIPSVYAGVSAGLSVWTRGVPNNFAGQSPEDVPVVREADAPCWLPLDAGPVERLSVTCRPAAGADGRVRCCLVPEDRFGNPSVFENPASVTLTWNGERRELDVQSPETLSLDPPADAVGRATVSVSLSALGPRENVANGRFEPDPDEPRAVVTGNPVWRDLPEGLRPAFGEFHWHTELSGDGQRTHAEAFAAARDAMNMDFAAPGDHNPHGEKWDRTVEAVQAANEEDVFATFFGWENGGVEGHENYYFTTPDHPLACGGSAGVAGGAVAEVPERIRHLEDFIAVPHHTNAVAATRRLDNDAPFWHPYPWTRPEAYIRLAEIFQGRGNQERDFYDDAWRGWHQRNGASVQEALRRGYRVGFTGGTDNHAGWPGRAFNHAESTGHPSPVSIILTGVWTERIRRREVFDGLENRRTWAVWNTRALVWMTLNGVPAGGELTVSAGQARTADVRLSAEAPLQTVEFVSAGEAIWQGSFGALDVEFQADLGPAVEDGYVYLRARTRDGGLIYASPVFISLGS